MLSEGNHNIIWTVLSDRTDCDYAKVIFVRADRDMVQSYDTCDHFGAGIYFLEKKRNTLVRYHQGSEKTDTRYTGCDHTYCI